MSPHRRGALHNLPGLKSIFATEPGDVLLAYTDGLSEALDVRGEEFGEARVREALAETSRMSADEIREEMVRRVREWCADTPQHDDLTFVVMKVRWPLISYR